jgi:thermitase
VTFGIAAPGDNIYSTFPNNDYKSFRGTSMACPFVASLIGIMKSIDPSLSTSEIHKLLVQGGIDTDQTSKTGKLIQPVATIRMMLD